MPTHHRVPLFLASLFVVVVCWSAIAPADNRVWWAEMVPIFAIFIGLAVTYKHFQFSNTSYLLMSVLLIMHTIGAHYTFAKVPFDWVTETFAFERNHYDRVAHFSVGFYAYAAAELLLRKQWARPVTAMLFGLFLIMAVAAAYEIIEWQFAVIEGGNAGIEFLGSQGDPWDAQKDMLADTLGAIAALVLFYFSHWVKPAKD
ncbi:MULTISPECIES: DUF2238 domain-containing protein [Idiomarina]|uniref:DUF2238 domain-containing protein n=1 Tax=Idiomarina TaxID=135575 RepID=UPI00129C2B89|nr:MULTISPECIES: DUF2238 domain-containing protein [Idiomarina]MRJ42312.1 DUF2238 domain-containing protein [Idiomarina sp. FeN1]NCU57437.1 DUF2238 domain-containing protein [Idiomarina sp. FenA--70]NCU60623.1 DUF2238 domain-containing protein [Idiomarina sp. FenBw--71]UUN14796.1 DUF2238 domain-containing protein [Idiomarina loihiensis]